MPKNIIKPNPISLTTHHLHIAYGDNILGSGTGFAYEKESKIYLITNWHIVTGRYPDTKKCISSTGGVPNVISTLFMKKGLPGHHKRENIQLYIDDDVTKPIWLEHPKRNQVDVVAIPLPKAIVQKYEILPINKLDLDPAYKEEVADEAFVIGYPFSDLTYLQLPIWKKASIASEPDVNLDQLPKMYIDTATREGLSGAPVIMQRTGVHGLVEGKPALNTIVGTIRNFIGIYSGRVGNDEFKAQLGIVWKARVLDEIIK